MRNIKIEIEYDGTSYCGWQVQKKHRNQLKSIQETIEKALQNLLQEKISLIVAGRTDAGVHAISQTANFRTSSKLDLKRIQAGANAHLPEDIVITGIREVETDFNSRFSAKSKVYRYTILNRQYRSVLKRKFAHFYPYFLPLDVKLMQKEAKVLLGKHNFKSFQATEARERNPVKTLKKLKITKEKDFIYFDFEADGFLYNMIRNIVGTLIEVGKGRIPPGGLKKILWAKDRRRAGPTLPAKGLCLVKVKY